MSPMYERMGRLINALSAGLYERDEAVRLGLLAAMAGESLFLLGPPGVGKSLIARRLEMVFEDAKIFTYLMGRFSTPDEVFGPLSIRALKQDDRYERVTENYLPDADVVFLDEIWKASAPIRNALLTALNERVFRNGTEEIALPLKVFIGASNELPQDDETAEAFWDRFLIRLVLEPIADRVSFNALISDTSDIYRDIVPEDQKISSTEYNEVRVASAAVQIPPDIGSLLAETRERLAQMNQVSSDRRWKKIAGLLRVSAYLHGRDRVELIDCPVARHCLWNDRGSREPVFAGLDETMSAAAIASVDTDGLRQQRSDLETRIDGERFEVVEEVVVEPVLHREEYYRLLGPKKQPRAESLLIWHGDVDEAGVDPFPADVFSYDADGTLLGSDDVTAVRTGEASFTIDGVSYAIETANKTSSVTRSRDLSGEKQAALKAEADALIARIQKAVDHFSAAANQVEDAATGHLFVSRNEVSPIIDSMRAEAERLVKLRLEVERLGSDLQDGR